MDNSTNIRSQPTSSNNRNKRPGYQSKARQKYQRGRVDTMRETKGSVAMANLHEDLRAKLFVGTGENDALARLSEQQTLKAITLSITTRGIGMGICHLSYISISYHTNIQIPNIYALYRVSLGLVEAKLESIKKDMPVVPRFTDQCYQYQVNGDMLLMLRVAQAISAVPEPIRKIIDAIGYLKYEEKVYCPAIAKDVMDRRNTLVPRPENLVLSNLRQVVTSLADPNTPRAYREAFHRNSPIPGAIWINDVLQNADEIIPANYNIVEDFRRDSHIVAPFMAVLQRYVPKMVSGPLKFSSDGSPSLLISNDMQTLRAPDRGANQALNDYYRNCLPLGNVRSYQSAARLTAPDRIEGQITLLGEYPSQVNFRYPLYHMRDEAAAAYEITSDYAGISQLYYAL